MERITGYPAPTKISEKDHPNFEHEKYFEALENLVTLEGNSDDYANLSYLSFNLFKQKFNDYESNLFDHLKTSICPIVE
jgi:hypothetical protein